MRVLGIELACPGDGERPRRTLVALDADGSFERAERVGGMTSVATAVRRLADGEPFLLGLDIPVVVPPKAVKVRPVESLLRRRFRARIASGGRAASDSGGPAGEALMAALATAGLPCLPYPDRDRRNSGLAETHTGLILQSLLWQASGIAPGRDPAVQEQLFRAWTAPAYRRHALPARSGWPDQTVALETTLAAIGSPDGYDLAHVREALRDASSEDETEAAAALFDATLIAATARRYLEAPEGCLFAGERESGYVILPADGLMRRLWLSDGGSTTGELFPRESLRERLGADARIRPIDLLNVPGRPERFEASFHERPLYEFDNVDEMLWWKHCRHLTGPQLPVNGLQELYVELDANGGGSPLRLVRSRHRALSFRFDRPEAWRRHVPTRDNRTYPFRVLRAVYEIAADD